MGLQKVAFNFMVERGGKLVKSLLCSKPVKKLDVSSLGVCLSNGNIHFQTEQAAINYIRHRLLDSLNRPMQQQFERAITKKGTRILAETNGTRTYSPPPFTSKEISERLNDNAIRDIELWHSHPDFWGKGKTAPLSPPDGGDIAMLNELHLKKMVAMNSKGEINSMEVAQGYTPEKFKEFRQNFENFMQTQICKLLPEKAQRRMAEIEKYVIENQGKEIPSALKKEIDELEQLCIKAQSSGEGAKLMHEYYKTADKYGMKYYTDFSNL
jgi:hypothetical protein